MKSSIDANLKKDVVKAVSVNVEYPRLLLCQIVDILWRAQGSICRLM